MAHVATPPTMPRQIEDDIPNGEFYRDGRLQIVIAGLDKNVRPVAVEVANDRLREKMGKSGFKGFIQRVWYGSFAKETFLSRETVKAQQAIRENNNLYHHEGGDDELDRQATTERFAHEYDELIHEEAGEHRTVLSGEEGAKLKEVIEMLITTYVEDASGEADENFEEEKKRLISEMVADGRLSPDLVGEGLLYADNLLQIAQNVKAMIDHKHFVNAQEALKDADITLGEARIGARTEMDRRLSERVAEKLSKSNIPFPNEVAVATAVSIVYTATAYAAKRGLGSALGTIAPGLAGGAIAGFREAKTVKEQRSMVGRKIEGGKLGSLTGSDAEIAETYEIVEAHELIDILAGLYDSSGRMELTDHVSVRDAGGVIADIRANIRLADQGRQLLIFADEDERFRLDLALAKAERDVAAFIDAMTEDDRKLFGDYAYGHVNETPSAGRNYLMSRVDDLEEIIERDYIDQKDQLYRKMRNKRIALAAVRGTVIGGSIGFAAQELMALVNPDEQGLIEGMLGHDAGAHHQTALENLVHPNIQPAIHIAPNVMHLSGDLGQPVELGDHSNIVLPSEFRVVHDGSTLTITGPQGIRIEHITLTPDGHLTPGSEQLLRESGFSITSQNDVVSHAIEQHVTVSPEQFLKNHPGMSANVVRDFWYKGDSQGLSYEAGPNGSYVVHLGGLNSELTAANGSQMSLQEAAAHGDIKVAISLTSGTQTHVIMVPLDAHGNAVIPAHSELSQLFQNNNGSVEFRGQYLEVVQDAGKDPSGLTHIRPIATDVGPNSITNLADITTATQYQTNTGYTLHFTPTVQPGAVIAPVESDVVIPPYIPVAPSGESRRSRRQRSGPEMEPAVLPEDDEFDLDDESDVEAAELEKSLNLNTASLGEILGSLGAEWKEKIKRTLDGARRARPVRVSSEEDEQGDGVADLEQVAAQPVAAEGDKAPVPEWPEEPEPVPSVRVVPAVEAATPPSEHNERVEGRVRLNVGAVYAADFGRIGKYDNFNGLVRLQNINDGEFHQFVAIDAQGARIPGRKMSLRGKLLERALANGVFQEHEPIEPEQEAVVNDAEAPIVEQQPAPEADQVAQPSLAEAPVQTPNVEGTPEVHVNDVFNARFVNDPNFGNYFGLAQLVNFNGNYYRFYLLDDQGNRRPGNDRIRLGKKSLAQALASGALELRGPIVAEEAPVNEQGESVPETPVVAQEVPVVNPEGQQLEVEEAAPLSQELVNSSNETGSDGFRYVPSEGGFGFAIDNFAPYRLPESSSPNAYNTNYSDQSRDLTQQVLNYVGSTFGERNNEQALIQALEVIRLARPTPEQRAVYDEAGRLLDGFMVALRRAQEPIPQVTPAAPSTPENTADRYATIRNLPVDTVLEGRFRGQRRQLFRYLGNTRDAWQFEPVNDRGEALTDQDGLVLNGESTREAFIRGELLPLPLDHPLRR